MNSETYVLLSKNGEIDLCNMDNLSELNIYSMEEIYRGDNASFPIGIEGVISYLNVCVTESAEEMYYLQNSESIEDGYTEYLVVQKFN